MFPSPEAYAELSEELAALLALSTPSSSLGTLSPKKSARLTSRIQAFTTNHPPRPVRSAERPLVDVLRAIEAHCFDMRWAMMTDHCPSPSEAPQGADDEFPSLWCLCFGAGCSWSEAALAADEELAGIYELVCRALYGRHTPLALPA